jgi:hypothetical protein
LKETNETRKTMREIKTHQINGLNQELKVVAIDAPGQGGACHHYKIGGTGQLNLPCEISFQNGPIKEHGINGISNEALLAVVRDRLEFFQQGAFACNDNLIALDAIVTAMDALANRTRDRVDRGVEGRNEK